MGEDEGKKGRREGYMKGRRNGELSSLLIVWAFEISNPISSDTLHLAMPHFLNLPNSLPTKD